MELQAADFVVYVIFVLNTANLRCYAEEGIVFEALHAVYAQAVHLVVTLAAQQIVGVAVAVVECHAGVPAVCCSLVVANLYTVVGVAVLQALNVGAGLSTQCLSEHAVFICQVCAGVGILHIVTPGVQGGGCCASYALHYKGFVVAFNDLRPVYTVKVIFALAVFIPMQSADVNTLVRRGQTFCNLYLTDQVVAVCFVVLISNLLCQSLQGCFNSIFVLHVNAAVIGGQDYAGAFFCLIDNSITGLVVGNVSTCIFVTVDDGFPTAIISNLESLSSLGHVQVAGFSLSFTAIDGQTFCRSCSRSFCNSQPGHACCFITIGQVPDCTVSNVHYDAAVAINIVAAGHFGILFGQVDYYAAAICCINITVDSAACFATVYSNVAAVSIDAAVNSQCAVVAINIHITVFACIDCSVSTADSAAAVQGYVAVCCIDANITANIGVALNSNICTICIDAGFTLQLQLSLSSIDVDIFIGCIYCCAAFNLNLSRILSEYIRAVFLQNTVLLVLIVSLGIAGNTLVLFSSFRLLGFRIGEARLHGTVLQTTLTSISIEGDVAGLHCCTACSQTIGNLHITGQVAFAVYEIAVGQLACQCLQNISYAYPVIHINTAVVGNHGYYRACCRTLDNGVACCVVFSCFTVAGMSVEDVSIAAVVVDSQVSAILLEDVACSCFACTTCQFCYMAAVEATVCFAPNLIIPGCAVIQVHIDNAIILRECNAGQGGFLV